MTEPEHSPEVHESLSEEELTDVHAEVDRVDEAARAARPDVERDVRAEMERRTD